MDVSEEYVGLCKKNLEGTEGYDPERVQVLFHDVFVSSPDVFVKEQPTMLLIDIGGNRDAKQQLEALELCVNSKLYESVQVVVIKS